MSFEFFLCVFVDHLSSVCGVELQNVLCVLNVLGVTAEGCCSSET